MVPETVARLPQDKLDCIEVLAAIEHERWSHWQQYLHSKCTQNEDGSLTIPQGLVERWNRQIETHYDDLSEEEKSSDKNEVYRYWPVVRAFFESRGADPLLK